MEFITENNELKKRDSGRGVPLREIRETVIKLYQQGWHAGEIAQALKLSLSEVELIIELGVENMKGKEWKQRNAKILRDKKRTAKKSKQQVTPIMPDIEKKEILTEEALLEHFTKIVALSKEKGLDKIIENARHHLDVVSKELHITPIQVVMYAHVFDTSLNVPPVLSKPGRFLYFGYPGSGTAKQLAEDAMLLFQDGKRYSIVGFDEYHTGIHQNLRTYAEIIGIGYEEFSGPTTRLSWWLDQKGIETALVYLRGFSRPDSFCYFYQSLFRDKNFTKLLILDCTRKDDLNLSLINGIGRENIDGVVLTKVDMILDAVKFFDYIRSINLPIAGFSDNEDISLPNELWYKRRSSYAIPMITKRH